MTELLWNQYGKSRVRLLKVRRRMPEDEIVDLTLDIRLEGAFESVYVDGDNRSCLPTDTMKNTVYALARHDSIEHVEAFALRLADHFAAKSGVSKAIVDAVEHRWERARTANGLSSHAFVRATGEQWTVKATRDASGGVVRSGLANLVMLKTRGSAFAGFPRDEFTTLPDTRDRILASSVSASWGYVEGIRRFGVRDAVRQTLIDTFSAHDSQSVQQTLYAMGAATLAACGDLADITLSMPNLHHLLVDLAPFGLDNPNEVFVATDQPFGLIEATLRR